MEVVHKEKPPVKIKRSERPAAMVTQGGQTDSDWQMLPVPHDSRGLSQPTL